jgi:hypothetical protein
MKIAHYIDKQYPLKGYGGTERIAYWLAKAQVELGHEVVFLCKPDSSLPFAETIGVPSDVDNLNPYVPQDVDIVQLYSQPAFQLDKPFLAVEEGNGFPGQVFHPNTVFVTENHAKRHRWTEFVYNGLDIAEYPLQTVKQDFVLFLAKADWVVKNLPGSAKIANDAGVKLHVGGGQAPFWFKNTQSHGVVDGQEKLKLIQNASCLLFPIIWDEHFGIVAIEALACGTPVIATPRGSLPEIVTPDCGILANSHQKLVEALHQRTAFDPHACRQRVLDQFTHIHMANKYLHYYERILQDGRIREGMPQAIGKPRRNIFYKQNPEIFLKNILTAGYIKIGQYVK